MLAAPHCSKTLYDYVFRMRSVDLEMVLLYKQIYKKNFTSVLNW